MKVTDYSDGRSELYFQLVNKMETEILYDSKEEVEYIKEELAKAFIEDSRRVFDVQSELWAFRKAKEGDKIDG